MSATLFGQLRRQAARTADLRRQPASSFLEQPRCPASMSDSGGYALTMTAQPYDFPITPMNWKK
jgi:hypothetical protein